MHIHIKVDSYQTCQQSNILCLKYIPLFWLYNCSKNIGFHPNFSSWTCPTIQQSSKKRGNNHYILIVLPLPVIACFGAIGEVHELHNFQIGFPIFCLDCYYMYLWIYIEELSICGFCQNKTVEKSKLQSVGSLNFLLVRWSI
jgi:hypothetical protein